MMDKINCAIFALSKLCKCITRMRMMVFLHMSVQHQELVNTNPNTPKEILDFISYSSNAHLRSSDDRKYYFLLIGNINN